MKLLPYFLFEKCVYILALEKAGPGNRHCVSCIGTISFPVLHHNAEIAQSWQRFSNQIQQLDSILEAPVRQAKLGINSGRNDRPTCIL